VVCTPQTVKALSAVGYYFGREIQDKTKVPVGMINTASGGSTAQTWISEGAFKGNEKLGGPADISSPNVKSFYDRLESYQKARTEWETAAAEAKVQKKPVPPQPASPLVGSGYPPSGTYNAMLAPIAPYGVRGAIWYQGEANTGYPAIYAKVMSLLIDDWRRAFNRPEMPFLLVQLPAFNPDNVPPGNWAALREQQVKITKDVPNTGMAVTIDVGDPKDIHPKNKKPVGYRLALVALKNVYKKDLVSSGPTYDSMKVDGNRIRLTLGNIGGGLVTSDGKDVAGFTIAGADHVFVPAQAKIEGGQVIVWSDDVGDPQAARYAWADYPTCNLANKEGLPAGPFRTDDWPLTRPTTRGR
jgi:sialate O-acetylesterase